MGDRKFFKRTLISAVCTLAFTAAGSAYAANWLMLQGTEAVRRFGARQSVGFRANGLREGFQ